MATRNRNADRIIVVFEEFGSNDTTSCQIGLSRLYEELGDGSNRCTYTNSGLGLRALYEIATLPESMRGQPHTIPSTGETKPVDEMTVRTIRVGFR